MCAEFIHLFYVRLPYDGEIKLYIYILHVSDLAKKHAAYFSACSVCLICNKVSKQVIVRLNQTERVLRVVVSLFLQPQERKQAVLHQLSELFGSEALAPLDYCERNWSHEPYCSGGPVSVCTPGVMTYAAAALRLPFDRLDDIQMAFCKTYTHTGSSALCLRLPGESVPER